MLAVMQRVLIEALHAEDPAGRLWQAAADPELSLDEAERHVLREVDAEGLRVASLLVRKLRFQRLITDPEHQAEFQRDPRAWVTRFRRYERDCPPTELFPEGERRCWTEWSK